MCDKCILERFALYVHLPEQFKATDQRSTGFQVSRAAVDNLVTKQSHDLHGSKRVRKACVIRGGEPKRGESELANMSQASQHRSFQEPTDDAFSRSAGSLNESIFHIDRP